MMPIIPSQAGGREKIFLIRLIFQGIRTYIGIADRTPDRYQIIIALKQFVIRLPDIHPRRRHY